MSLHTYTAHLKPGREPILVREGWSWGAALFGPIWFAAQRAWIPAAIDLALLVAAAVLRGAPVTQVALGILAGLLGRDTVRWSLDRRGYVVEHVLAARDEDTAFARLLTYRPDVAARLAEPLP